MDRRVYRLQEGEIIIDPLHVLKEESRANTDRQKVVEIMNINLHRRQKYLLLLLHFHSQ
jgi:hypothetical protein